MPLSWFEFLRDLWPHLLGTAAVAATAAASIHALLFKRDVRATIGWIGVIWLAPILGALLYLMFGVNRIRRRAVLLRSGQPQTEPTSSRHTITAERFEQVIGAEGTHLKRLVELIEVLTERPLLAGNQIDPLNGGDEAYPAMLDAIGSAQRSVALATYIFDNDRVGQMFVDALAQAVGRGVEVRVLIDDIGLRYTIPSVMGKLRRAGVRADRFMRTLVPAFLPYANLRSHRKILVVDGRIGFTGGLNIREGCWLSLQPRHAVQDLHFRLRGPAVTHLLEVFAEDWAYTNGEVLEGDTWYAPHELAGPTLARGIRYGPDEDLGEMRLALMGALAVAERSVQIVTPYFLPDDALCQTLSVAAMRGVEVDIILPEVNNLKTVQWACNAMLWQVLERGCRVWFSPPPFDHSKLMIVDSLWVLFGSGNWDQRSLRLNFEFNVEVYDAALAGKLESLVASKKRGAREVTLAQVDGRPFFIKLRDGIARLLTPYL